ncbi:MAG TPA: hypothetical protein VFM88_04365 [Vicinamibacteria bacterium]|nr:hypothetical protein [Vicinamibacteria bacterium]
MKHALGVLAVVSLSVVAPAAEAQQGNLAQIFFNKVKPGAQEQYEAARQRHMEWHRSKGDSWAWFTWEIATGDRTGTFVVGTFDRSFKDFDGRDEFEAADAADSAANMGPFVESSTQSLYLRRPDMGGEPPTGTPSKLSQVIHFHVNPASVNDFVESVRKVAEAAKKTSYPIRPDWYQLFSGGMGPEFVLVYGRSSWADLQPPDKTLDAMVEDALGRTQAASVLMTLRRAVRYTDSELLVYRPELSYVPGK